MRWIRVSECVSIGRYTFWKPDLFVKIYYVDRGSAQSVSVYTNETYDHAILHAAKDHNIVLITSDVIVSGQGIGHQKAVRVSPRRVQLPAVGYQTVAQLVGRVQERVLASLWSDVNGDVGNKRVCVRVFRSQRVFSQNRVRFQVENVDGVRAHLLGRVAYLNDKKFQSNIRSYNVSAPNGKSLFE